MRPINLIVVHHSASHPRTTAEDISRWHSAPKPIGRGWRWGTGYHRIIEADGAVLDGRKIQRQGAHARGSNTNSVGIVGVGDNTRPGWEWTRDVKDSLVIELTYWTTMYPLAPVKGHRDTPGASTECPGLDIADWCRDHGIEVYNVG